MSTHLKTLLRQMVPPGFLAVFLFFVSAVPALAGADPLPEDKAAAVLALLRSGAGSITSMHADFIQEKRVPGPDATLFARGRVSLRSPNSLRWEMVSPVKAGYVLNGNASASWTNAGGQAVKTPLRETPRADGMARFVVSCLAFNEQALRQRCVLDVIRESPPTVRLVPKNDMLRAHLSELVLTFTPDGALPHSVRVVTARGGDSLVTLVGVVRDDALLHSHDSLESVLENRPEPPGRRHAGKGRLFSAALTEGKRKLPLLLYVWREDGTGGKETLHCEAFTEVLFGIGSVAVTETGVAAGASAPDSQAVRVLERIGTAFRHLNAGEGRYADKGWSLAVLPVAEEE